MILKSITSRLVLSYCLLLVFLGGAFLLFTVLSFEHYAQETISDNLATRTQEIWNTAEGLLDQPQRLAEVMERRFSPESQDRFIRIRAGGTTLYRSGDPVERDFSAGAVAIPDRLAAPGISHSGNLLLYAGSFNDAHAGPVTIETGQSYAFARAVQGRLATSLLVGLPVLLLLAALAGYTLMRKALNPVETMINAAEAYTFNDPHSRLPLVGTEPRIEALGLALNRLLDRLDGAYAHVSRFSADAAHELRTPLTIIRGELEFIATEVEQSSDLDRAIANAMEEMTRLSGIVDSLITLSRMESLWGKRAHANLDLVALANETLEQMNLLAEEKRIALHKPSATQLVVAGDRDRLKQVLVNLVDNAIKYTQAGGTVRVEIAAAADKVLLIVEDNGIGIDPEHQERIFDRFYRVSTDRGDVGAGLGLAIVKSICHAHGGTVTLKSVPDAGSRFVVELPLVTTNLPGNLPAPNQDDQIEVAAAGAAAAREFRN